MSSNISLLGLRIVLFLASLPIMLTGINIALGGIFTLGLQGDGNFAEVTNELLFLTQDSHIRFIGGVWFSIGVLFIISSINPVQFQAALKFAIFATFIGGVSRFSQNNLYITLGPDVIASVIASVIAEVLVMPVLYFWLHKVIKHQKLNS